MEGEDNSGVDFEFSKEADDLQQDLVLFSKCLTGFLNPHYDFFDKVSVSRNAAAQVLM